MSDEPKTNGVADERARKDTPIVSVGGPVAAADRIAGLQRSMRRALGLIDEVERLVRARGFDPQSRAALSELAEYFDDELPTWAASTGRVLRRLADLG